MRFRESLWDDSDPDYAPGINWRAGKARWMAPRRYVKAGWRMTYIRLPGRKGDGRDTERAAICRDLTREMVRWFKSEQPEGAEPDTWRWLILRYRTDEFSPFQTVRHSTRYNYAKMLDVWMQAIGARRISSTRYEDIMRWYDATVKAHPGGSPRISNGHHMMTMLRAVVSHGVRIEAPHAARLKAILGECRFKQPRPRTVAPTREEIERIVEQALKEGLHTFAIGLRMQFDLALRAGDVVGVWEPADNWSGIVRRTTRNGETKLKRWVGGVTWEMISDDLSTLTKTARKTEDYADEAVVYDLTAAPELRKLLSDTPTDRRVGPVVVTGRRGLPYNGMTYSRLFVRLRDAAGVRSELRNMDTRAGAITEAGERGASLRDRRLFAQHRNEATTARYDRGKSRAVANVMRLRSADDKP